MIEHFLQKNTHHALLVIYVLLSKYDFFHFKIKYTRIRRFFITFVSEISLPL